MSDQCTKTRSRESLSETYLRSRPAPSCASSWAVGTSDWSVPDWCAESLSPADLVDLVSLRARLLQLSNQAIDYHCQRARDSKQWQNGVLTLREQVVAKGDGLFAVQKLLRSRFPRGQLPLVGIGIGRERQRAGVRRAALTVFRLGFVFLEADIFRGYAARAWNVILFGDIWRGQLGIVMVSGSVIFVLVLLQLILSWNLCTLLRLKYGSWLILHWCRKTG